MDCEPTHRLCKIRPTSRSRASCRRHWSNLVLTMKHISSTPEVKHKNDRGSYGQKGKMGLDRPANQKPRFVTQCICFLSKRPSPSFGPSCEDPPEVYPGRLPKNRGEIARQLVRVSILRSTRSFGPRRLAVRLEIIIFGRKSNRPCSIRHTEGVDGGTAVCTPGLSWVASRPALAKSVSGWNLARPNPL